MFRLPIRSILVLAAFTASAHGQPRYHQYTQQFANPKQPAVPVASGYLGGEGDEYLIGGAFFPDGSLVLAGNAFGPTFAMPGAQVRVLGRDTHAPDFSMPFQAPRREGQSPRMQPPNWEHLAGAGFLVKLDSEYRRIESAIRFPWGSGSLTDVVISEQGHIYVTGIVGPQFAALTPSRELPRSFEEPDQAFLGRLTPDLQRFEWCIRFNENKQQPPKLGFLEDGTISLIAKNAYHFSPEGEPLKATRHGLPGGYTRAIHPMTHALARGRDHNTRTGWEPWRRPTLQLFDEAGTHTDTFYQWDAQLVGTNWSRLVSDSDIRLLNYDQAGNLLVVGWSDGGNSVLEYLPQDLRTSVQADARRRTGEGTGLGFSTWGAGVGSFTHMMKIDTDEVVVLGKTLFCAYLGDRNRPNSASVEFINSAADNSVLIGGGSAWGLIETSSLKLNTLSVENDDYMGGAFVAVLNERMNDIRFSSALPGAGQVSLNRHSGSREAKYATGTRNINGVTHVVFVSGAVDHDKFKPANPVQQAFGGGNLDGLFVVLRMDTLELGTPRPLEEESAAAAGEREGGRQRNTPDGTFQISQGMNRHFSVLYLRDSTRRRWPIYILARPEGESRVDSAGSGQFRIKGPGSNVQLLQGRRQEPRLAGNLVRQENGNNVYPDMDLAVRLVSADRAQGMLRFNGRTVELEGPCTIGPSRPSGHGIQIGGTFRTTKAALGLDGRDPDDANDVLILEYWVPGRPL
ncbi:MAG: hypothetical protein LAT83_19235 [Kiritimatiellae bacterium]|nr:hypothetical protein [Kiritimatiellia bacterium]